MPRLPDKWRELLKTAGIEGTVAETLLEAQVEFNDEFLQAVAGNLTDKGRGKAFANWIINLEIPLRRQCIAETGKDLVIDAWKRDDAFDYVYKMTQSKAINSNQAAALLSDILKANDLPSDLEAYAKKKGYLQVSDEGEIAKIVKQVLTENAKAAEDVKNGEMKAVGFLVGQVMKLSRGQANPQLAQELIRQQLGL